MASVGEDGSVCVPAFDPAGGAVCPFEEGAERRHTKRNALTATVEGFPTLYYTTFLRLGSTPKWCLSVSMMDAPLRLCMTRISDSSPCHVFLAESSTFSRNHCGGSHLFKWSLSAIDMLGYLCCKEVEQGATCTAGA